MKDCKSFTAGVSVSGSFADAVVAGARRGGGAMTSQYDVSNGYTTFYVVQKDGKYSGVYAKTDNRLVGADEGIRMGENGVTEVASNYSIGGGDKKGASAGSPGMSVGTWPAEGRFIIPNEPTYTEVSQSPTGIGSYGNNKAKSEGGWFGSYSDAVSAAGIVVTQLNPAFEGAASLAKHNPSYKVPVFLRNFNAPANKLLYMGRVKGSTAIRISNTLKTVAPGLTALSVVNTGIDIISDGRLSYGDAFQAINTGFQLAFPVYGVIYGLVDIGVSFYSGGTSLTSMIKTGIDSNLNASYDF